MHRQHPNDLAKLDQEVETVDPDLVIAHPDREVPPRAELLEAMERAFASEEDVEDGLLERYAHHAELVLAGNRRMNLISHPEPYDLAVTDYLDAWRVIRLLPLEGRSVFDLGSGAGFPGHPIALAEPSTRVVLCDANRNRWEFLQASLDAMGTKNVSCVGERGEDHLARHHYDLVILRGVESIRGNVRMLSHVRRSFKQLVMIRPPIWSGEVRSGEREIERLGFRLDRVLEHELPWSSLDSGPPSSRWGRRAVLVYHAPGEGP